MVSPFSVHQQQLAMLAQQQSLLMAAAEKSNGMSQTFSGSIHQPISNGYNIHTQNWGSISNQVPQGIMPIAQHQKPMQVGFINILTEIILDHKLIYYIILFLCQMWNIQSAHIAGISVPFPASRYSSVTDGHVSVLMCAIACLIIRPWSEFIIYGAVRIYVYIYV